MNKRTELYRETDDRDRESARRRFSGLEGHHYLGYAVANTFKETVRSLKPKAYENEISTLER